MDTTPNLGLPYIMAAQAQKHVTHNEAIRALDALVQLTVASRALTSPPASPAAGARYIVAKPAAGAWSGHGGAIAAFQDGGWLFYPPAEGWIAWVADEDKLSAFDGTDWVVAGASSTLPLLGLNTTADTTNRLAVASPAALFTHDGAGHQVKINKAAATDTGSLLFQTGYSGRAEFGLAGDDDVRLKVSADGATWRTALAVDRASGRVQFPSGGAVAVRETSVVLAVPAQYATIQQALDALVGVRFTGSAQGIVEVAAGTTPITAPLRIAHPQSTRIVIRAAAAITPLAELEIPAAKAAAETAVRARYGVILDCQSTSAIALGSGEGVMLQDIALIKSGSGSYPGIDLLGGAQVQLTRSVVFGFAFGLAARHGARVVLDQASCLLFADQHGATLDTGAGLRTTGTAALIMRNGQYGVRASGTSALELTLAKLKANGASGVLVEAQSGCLLSACDVRDNGANGVQATYGSTITIQGSTLAPNGQRAVSAAYGSTVSATGITVGGTPAQSTLTATAASLLVSSGSHTGTPVFDPAIGSTGNNGSWSV